MTQTNPSTPDVRLSDDGLRAVFSRDALGPMLGSLFPPGQTEASLEDIGGLLGKLDNVIRQAVNKPLHDTTRHAARMEIVATLSEAVSLFPDEKNAPPTVIEVGNGDASADSDVVFDADGVMDAPQWLLEAAAAFDAGAGSGPKATAQRKVLSIASNANTRFNTWVAAEQHRGLDLLRQRDPAVPADPEKVKIGHVQRGLDVLRNEDPAFARNAAPETLTRIFDANERVMAQLPDSVLEPGKIDAVVAANEHIASMTSDGSSLAAVEPAAEEQKLKLNDDGTVTIAAGTLTGVNQQGTFGVKGLKNLISMRMDTYGDVEGKERQAVTEDLATLREAIELIESPEADAAPKPAPEV